MDSNGITSVLNFRDVGSTVNRFQGRRTEHAQQARKRKTDLQIPALLQSNAALAEPVQIPGLKYHDIRITGGRFEWFLVRQLSWWGLYRLVVLFLLGYRNEGISVLASEVMVPRGLVRLGLDTLDQSGEEIAKALRVFLNPLTTPTLVHCTQGKDRTGMIITLVLLALDVPLEAIEHDYMLTSGALESEREERLTEIREIGLTDDWFEPAPDMIARTARHLDEDYGGIVGYLGKIGFDQYDCQKLKKLLLY
ncbi:Tyrosine-protein phosphatase [Colletotrichum shisoi]|uniref:Tyrosine-protein phosphatase n=1 Tax=Colletotrichum shisoi TaxID=2078593 RepID=A0A5Q4C4V1_9PEZI|nr:Tyrosine-protein phosphatase [Colletotrichum shisoi]